MEIIKTDIPVPRHLIRDKNQDQIDFSLTKGKIIVGLSGYAKSGKDTLANCFVGDGFKRIAFADAIKEEMNTCLKRQILKEIKECNRYYKIGHKHDCGILKYIGEEESKAIDNLDFDSLDFFSEIKSVKRVIRPYIIWLGEMVKRVNGMQTWANKALKSVESFDKIILSDVRRPNELDLFRNSKNSLRKVSKSYLISGYRPEKNDLVEKYETSMETFLFLVNQHELRDDDTLTTDTIRIAEEEWLFDDAVYVDPRIPEYGKYRERFIQYQYGKLIEKFNIIF